MKCIVFLIILVQHITSLEMLENVCTTDNFIAKCKNQSLSTVPSDLDENITLLDLSANEFTRIPKEVVKFTKLKHLNISYNKITFLNYHELIGILHHLETLDLSHNVIRRYGQLSNIRSETMMSLNLSFNPLNNLDANFLQLRNLKNLVLQSCDLTNLDNDFLKKFPNLAILDLSQNNFSNFNSTQTSSRLRVLDLTDSGIRHFHKDALSELTNLTTLFLDHNKDLKRFTSSSETLKLMSLVECGLENVPNGILHNLEELNLFGNNVQELRAHSMSELKNLRKLNLASNAIKVVDSQAFIDLGNLAYVTLSDNKIITLEPKVFTFNPLLTKVDLSNNYFGAVVELVSNSIQNLNLEGCKISYMRMISLINMPKLESLNMAVNQIALLPDSFVAERLSQLDLSTNRLKSINNATFSSTPQLRFLILSGNSLTYIHPAALPNRLVYIDIKDNPWRCDCDALRPMHQWLQRYMRQNEEKCQSPERYEGIKWVDACEWYQNQSGMPFWWYGLAFFIVLWAVFGVVFLSRRLTKLKKERIARMEQSQRAAEREELERIRALQQLRENEHQNAPDPRNHENQLPSYTEALLLPRADLSHPSLADSLHSIAASNPDIVKKRRVRRKRRNRSTTSLQRMSRSEDSTDSDPERNMGGSAQTLNRRPARPRSGDVQKQVSVKFYESNL